MISLQLQIIVDRADQTVKLF